MKKGDRIKCIKQYTFDGKNSLLIGATFEVKNIDFSQSVFEIIDIHGRSVWFNKNNEYFEMEEIKTPSHYDNSKGTLYKVALERGWNAYLFEVVKRIERAEKKGEFISDIKKSIHVLELYLEEQGEKFKNQIEPLNNI